MRRSQTLMHLSTLHEKSWKPSSLIATCNTEAVCPDRTANGFGFRVYGFQRLIVRSRPHEASCFAVLDHANE